MIMTIMTMTTITATNIMTMKNKQIHVQTQIVDATNMNIMTTITATAITMNIMNTKQKQTHAQTQTATATNMKNMNTKQKQTHAQDCDCHEHEEHEHETKADTCTDPDCDCHEHEHHEHETKADTCSDPDCGCHDHDDDDIEISICGCPDCADDHDHGHDHDSGEEELLAEGKPLIANRPIQIILSSGILFAIGHILEFAGINPLFATIGSFQLNLVTIVFMCTAIIAGYEIAKMAYRSLVRRHTVGPAMLMCIACVAAFIICIHHRTP